MKMEAEYTPDMLKKLPTLKKITHLDPVDGGNMCLPNIGNSTHTYTVQEPKSRINMEANIREKQKSDLLLKCIAIPVTGSGSR
jgi:hypothetical protein